MDTPRHIAQLILLQLKDELDARGMNELNAWVNQSADNQKLYQQLTDPAALQTEMTAFYRSRKNVLDKIRAAIQAPKVIPLWKKMTAAASIILVLGLGSYLIFFNKPAQPSFAKTISTDVNPGSYKARLTLADGSTIILDSAAPGQLVQQGNTAIISQDGKLVYKPSGEAQEVLYNTVATAKGETYTMTLADGSIVWLNSGSSIHFPVAFPGKERRIEVTGEVYVKVARNPPQPFIASSDGMEVLALGTEFNINSYKDEFNISTTLIEGSVKVSKDTASTILKQGQQTRLNKEGQLTVATVVNTEEVIAWKDGFFHFESADLKTILRQFARWYDIEVVYEGLVTKDKFFVIMNRNSTLNTVLKALQAGGVKFNIEDKKLIVKSG